MEITNSASADAFMESISDRLFMNVLNMF
jgi:hypothetical protein